MLSRPSKQRTPTQGGAARKPLLLCALPFLLLVLPLLCLAQNEPDSSSAKAGQPNQKSDAYASADQFPGADMCVQIQAAEAASGSKLIDATGFHGEQACSVDPLVNLKPHQTIRFGQVNVSSTVPWHIEGKSNGVNLLGTGIGQTLFHYTGASVPAFITVTGQNGGSFGDDFEGFSILGNKNAANGLSLYNTHHNMLNHIGCWGFANCLNSTASILNTWIKPTISIADAQWLWGYQKPADFAPHNGLYLASAAIPKEGVIQSTATTIVDALIENVAACGIDLVGAATTTITSGTSEGNGTGLCIAAGSNDNTIIGLDMESNTVQDVNDAGNSNRYENVIAISGAKAIQFVASASDWSIDGGTISKVVNSAVFPAWTGSQGDTVACLAGYVCSATSGMVSLHTAHSGKAVGDLFQGTWAAGAPTPRVCTVQEVDNNPVQVGIHQDFAVVSTVLFRAEVSTAPSPNTTYRFAYLCKP